MNYLALGLFVSISALSAVFPATAAANTTPLEGTLSIEFEDYEDSAELKYWLKDKQGKRTEILLEKQPSWLKTGQKLRVHGNPQGKKFAVDEQSINLLESTETSTNTTTATASTTTNQVSGERNILVVEVHHPSYDVEMITREMIEDTLFTQTNQYFQEASYGKVSLAGDIASPIVVDYDTSVCDTWALADKADAALRADGFEPNNYDHVMYLITYYSACSWNGMGNVNGPRTWIKRFGLSTVKHELGHNLGLYHANKKDCGAQTTNSSECGVIEYGDVYSGMSNSSHPYHFNGFHKEQLGWLDNQVITLTSDGTATLAPLEENSNTPKVLKVLKNIDENGNSEWYYIEYRQAIGFDSDLSINRSHELSGVRLREGVENSPNTSALLDPTPQSTDYDWDDITIDPGQSYFDEQYGITISVISSDSGGVTIDVSYDGQGGNTCTTQSPAISALSSDATNVQPGDTVSFSYQVTNNDSSNCSTATFDISSSLPSGWTMELSQSQLSLSPGSSSDVTLYATVSGGAAEGNYSVTTMAQRNSSNVQVSTTNQVQVASSTTEPANQTPVATSDSVLLNSKTATTFDVLANDYDPDGDSLQVTATTQGSKGSVYLNADNSITYVPAKSFKSKDSFSYTISDGGLSATTTVNIELQGSSSDGGGQGGGKGKNK